MTTPAEDPELGPPLRGAEDLIEILLAGAKAERRIGMEYERLPVRADGSAAPFDCSVEPALADLALQGWGRYEEDGRLLALRGRDRSVSLEPGGQTEIATRPWARLADLAGEAESFWRALAPIAARRGFRFLGLGYQPVAPLETIRRLPKRRYDVMEPYLARRGRRAVEMMKATAGIQVALDYRDEAEAMEMLATALSVTSIVTALLANSAFAGGRPNGFASLRAATWLECDPDRCGLLAWAAEEGRTFRDYAAWVLDVPLIFVERGGRYWPSRGLTLRAWIRDGFEGMRPHRYDVETALTQVFPEVRLRRYVELRGADSQPAERAAAVAALWTGILYDAGARRAARALAAGRTAADRLSFHAEACRLGLAAPRTAGLARDLVAIAVEGLARVDAAARPLLAPIEEIVARGASPAEEALRRWEAAPPADAAGLIALLAPEGDES